MALTDNIVAYYKLDESSGTAFDSVASFDLTNNNTVTYASALINNGASGGTTNTNKYLSIANDLGITGTSISISMWVKMNTEIASGEQVFAEQGDLGTFVNNHILYDYNGGTRRIGFNRQQQNTANNFVYGNLTMGTSTYHHLVLTYDGTLRGYINGSSVGTPLVTSGNGASGTIDHFYLLANYPGSGSTPERHASATIDEVGVWTRAITASEVTELYNGGAGLAYPFTGGGFTPQVMIF